MLDAINGRGDMGPTASNDRCGGNDLAFSYSYMKICRTALLWPAVACFYGNRYEKEPGLQDLARQYTLPVTVREDA